MRKFKLRAYHIFSIQELKEPYNEESLIHCKQFWLFIENHKITLCSSMMRCDFTIPILSAICPIITPRSFLFFVIEGIFPLVIGQIILASFLIATDGLRTLLVQKSINFNDNQHICKPQKVIEKM